MFRFTLSEKIGSSLNRLPLAVHDTFPGVLFGRMLVLAVRLRFFETLRHRSQTPDELALSLNLDPRSVNVMCDALVHAGYLKNLGTKVALSPQSSKWLVASSPHYIGNFLAYIELLHHHWMSLEETIRTGNSAVKYVESFNNEEWKTYTLGMMDLAKLILPHISNRLRIPATARAMLDAGGSHGLYSIAMCNQYPPLTSTIIDYPQVLKITQTIIEEHNLSHRISLQKGDVRTMSLNAGHYDVVLAFNIIHGFDEETNRKLLARLSAAMTTNGVIYILDQFKNTRQRGAEKMLPLMVGLNLLNEIGGTTYRTSEVTSWCLKAGFTRITTFRLPLPGVGLLRAYKT